MITNNAERRCRTTPRSGLVGQALAKLALTATLLLICAATARADNVLQDVTYTTAAGGQVQVALKMAQPPADPKLFATQGPDRIAIDLDATKSEFKARKLNVGVGAVNAVSALEANGRTRVVIDLFRSAPYTARVEGNSLLVSIGTAASSTTVGAMISNDPTKALSANARPEIANVDFRRGKGGEGRMIVTFSGEGASADLQRQGTRIVVELSNVRLPDRWAQKLDVTDFATPVQSMEVRPRAGGARIEINTNGAYDQLAYQTATEYVVEVSAQTDTSAANRATREPEYTGERVTFNFQDIPVRSVLQLIADVSELNVVVSDTVQGNVTLRLINVPWDQALDIILRARGLDKRKQGNVLWVAPTQEVAQREQALEDARNALEQREQVVSEYIPINYGKAKDIVELMTKATNTGGQTAPGVTNTGRSGFLSPRGSVTYDDRTNTLLISDIPKKIREMRDLIAVLDRPVDQVLIESRIVVANESYGKGIGAKFGFTGAHEDRYGNVIATSGNSSATDLMATSALANRLNGSPTGLPVALPGIGNRLNVNLPAANATGTFGLALLTHDYLLDLELSALESEGRGQIVSSPRVITANQQEATIKQGDEVGYVTISPTAGGNTVPIPNVQFKEVLLELKVTPTITQDQRVYLVMDVKKDEISGFVNTSIGDVPQINKRQIKTAVLVENGQTVVLGGVYEFRSNDELAKVPFLANIPAIGNLFKRRTHDEAKAELLIFVTPKILAQSRK